MKFLYLGIFFIVFTCCSKKIVTSRYFEYKRFKDCIIVYKFKKSIGERYCLYDCQLVRSSNQQISFFDDYMINYDLLKEIEQDKDSALYKKLSNKLIPINSINMFPIINSMSRSKNEYPERRIGDTKFKYEVGNVGGGNYLIKSSNIYKKDKNCNEFLYIAFSIDLDLFIYNGFDHFIREKSKSYQGGCYYPRECVYNRFSILDKVKLLKNLNREQERSLKFEKVQVDSIKLLIIG